MTRISRLQSSLASLVALCFLASCHKGDLGPLALPLSASSSFMISASPRSRLTMKTGQAGQASFYYAHAQRSLHVSLGNQKLVFRGVNFNLDSGLLISSPSDSHVTDRQGLRVGAQITRRYLGGNSHFSVWDYRVHLFTERNGKLAEGAARVEEKTELGF